MSHWKFWNEETMGSNVLAFDTETTFEEDLSRTIPKLVLVSVSDGEETFILRREQLSEFFKRHQNREFVGHNVAFDFWVVDQFLREREENMIFSWWWNLLQENRLHDTMLLDQLVRLAKGFGRKGGIQRRSLDDLATDYCSELPRPDKDSPYRKKFGDLLTMHWGLVDYGFFDYASLDARVTWNSFRLLMNEAQGLIKSYDVPGNLWERYGPLTEALQVKSAIALRKVTLNGMAIDETYAMALEQEFRGQSQKDWDFLIANYPELFQYDRKGTMLLTEKGRTPSLKKDVLQKILEGEAVRRKQPVILSTGKTGGVSTSEKQWSRYVHPDEYTDEAKRTFLSSWCSTVRNKNLLKFFDIFRGCQGKIHPSYEVIKNTGRVSSYSPNIQQIPRNSQFRKIFVASPGFLLVTIDYAAIELRTLASVCYEKFGYSVLGDVIKGGRDPHAYTAAMINGMAYEDFSALKESDPKKFKRDRQSAKAVNFGTPGGLGPQKLVEYARANYSVTMTLEEAKEFRHRLITEVYPELNDCDGYLASTTAKDICRNLGISLSILRQIVRNHFGQRELGRSLYLMGRILKGDTKRKDGVPYEASLILKCRNCLKDLCVVAGHKDWSERTSAPEGDKDLYRDVFGHSAITLTGRIRGGTDFTDGKNTPFQSLAADGMKMAMWELIYRGIRVVAMIHDELLVEVSEATAGEEAKVIEKVLCEEMGKVLNNRVPVECEYHVDRHWRK